MLFLWFSYHIWQQVSQQPDWRVSWMRIKESALKEHPLEWLVLLLLMPVNWGIEALKWHRSIRHLQPLSFRRAFRAILTGLSFAVNTPNRTGEYMGRILYVEEGNRLKAIAVTIVNSWSQLIITLFWGGISTWYLIGVQREATIQESGLSVFWMQALQWIIVVITFFVFCLYMRLGWLVQFLEKVPFIGKYSRYFHVLREFSGKELWNMLLLSLLRYFVFIVQYQLAFHIFGVGLTWWQGFWMTNAVFLILAIIPTIALAELGLRGEISLQLLGMLSKNKIGIVAATGTIWFVNLLIPAIIGSILVIGIKIFRNK